MALNETGFVAVTLTQTPGVFLLFKGHGAIMKYG